MTMPRDRISTAQGRIIIAGTGRTGTTFLVQLLTALKFSTGFSLEDSFSKIDEIAQAGLEKLDLLDEANPYVIKSPFYADQIKPALQNENFKIYAALLPVRNLFAAAESRRRVYQEALNRGIGVDQLLQPGTLWRTANVSEQEQILAQQFFKTFYPLIEHEVPVYLFQFPRLIRDPEYLFRQLEPLMRDHGVSYAEFLQAHRRTARPELVHEFDETGKQPPENAAGQPTHPAMSNGVAGSKQEQAARGKPQYLEAIARKMRAAESSSPLKLSVVVVGFNMARELPRTIRSLSPDFQRDIAAADYEIIVVDNGSTIPVDETELRKLAGNLRVCRMRNATVSPVPAIQFGMQAGLGELVGVFIDGARMASPGLLAAALAASKLHERPAIGTVSFHLGPKQQRRSINEGYNQAVEDALLASSGWEQDGYKLFEISVLAGSSRGGWFAMPNETNAIFMRASHWRELGGYDANFVSPGGGFVNFDLWARACADPNARPILLLGEATFHQIHGGIATNCSVSRWQALWAQFRDEYVHIRGRPYARPTRQLYYYGTLPNSIGAKLSLPAASDPGPFEV